MRRWVKFELLDLQAILQAIEKKNEMDIRRQEKERKRNKDRIDLQNMRDGKKSLSTFFMSRDSKISRITNLTNSIGETERDIECLDLLHKIIVLQLNQAAIQFFKRDKFTTYNHTVNLYMMKQSENNAVRQEVYRKINSYNTKMVKEFQERRRLEDKDILMASVNEIKSQSRRLSEKLLANEAEETKKQTGGIVQVFGSDNYARTSVTAVVNGGYVNLENDRTLMQHEAEGYGLSDMQRVFQKRDEKYRQKIRSKSWLVANDTREDGKRDLLQYKIFDNDSDEDVFEGLGNTTIFSTQKGGIGPAGCSSDDDSDDSDSNDNNKKKDKDQMAGDIVDKKIIEIAVQQMNRSMQVERRPLGESFSDELFDSCE